MKSMSIILRLTYHLEVNCARSHSLMALSGKLTSTLQKSFLYKYCKPDTSNEFLASTYYLATRNRHRLRPRPRLLQVILRSSLCLDGCAPVSYTHLRAHETPEHLVC